MVTSGAALAVMSNIRKLAPAPGSRRMVRLEAPSPLIVSGRKGDIVRARGGVGVDQGLAKAAGPRVVGVDDGEGGRGRGSHTRQHCPDRQAAGQCLGALPLRSPFSQRQHAPLTARPG